MASLRHLARHLPLWEVAARHANCNDVAKFFSFLLDLFWFNVVLIKVNTFTIFDTMERMKGHQKTGNPREQFETN